jgi:hypothetical protein
MQSVKTWLILALSSIILSGCASFDFFGAPKEKPIEIKTVQQEKIHLNMSEPQPVETRKIKWFIITPDNADEVFAELSKQKYDVVLFGLTDDGYENLALNMAEIRTYILKQKGVIKAYKEYYEPVKITEEKDK